MMAKNILVVDDEKTHIRLVSFRLKSVGYDIMTAPSAEEGLKVLEQTLPDMILLDIHMPGMDGYEMCRTLKADDRFKNIPIIFISATSSYTEIAMNTKKLGVQGYIIKPYDPDVLLEKIKNNI